MAPGSLAGEWQPPAGASPGSVGGSLGESSGYPEPEEAAGADWPGRDPLLKDSTAGPGPDPEVPTGLAARAQNESSGASAADPKVPTGLAARAQNESSGASAAVPEGLSGLSRRAEDESTAASILVHDESRQAARVEEIRTGAGWLALRPEWDALAERTGAGPFLTWDFLAIWLDHFDAGKRPRVITVRDGRGRLVAALPLVERRSFVAGVPLRELRSASNAHSCRFDFLAEDPERIAPAVLAHLLQDRRWDLLRLLDVPDGGRGWALLGAARRGGLRVHTWESQRSPRFALDAMNISPGFRANLRRRRRRLSERGPVSFRRWTGSENLEARLESFFKLEASGWKGSRGTAIALEPRLRGFYRELARSLVARGSLVLSELRVGERLVAGHFALESGGTYHLLKAAYDEALAACSPGQLLVEEVVTEARSRGLRAFDFLGPDMPWKRDWTESICVHTWLSMYRDTPKARLAWRLKARWLPRLRAEVAWWHR
jgi:CelD/BcsL family acetyltransferase involved in cellulose biosynthesis